MGLITERCMVNRSFLLICALSLMTAACTIVQRGQSVILTARARPFAPTPGPPTTYAPPTRTRPPTVTEAPPSATPASTPEARAPEAILILEPGNLSAVVSPVRVAGEADPTFEQSLVVEITDAEGASLAVVPAQIQADLGQRGPFSVEVEFGVDADQPGRISVYSTSARDGGLIHLSSVEVTLLAGGQASIQPAEPREEFITLHEPRFLAAVGGGVVRLVGYSEYVFESALGVVICGEGGVGAPDPLCGTADNVLGAGVAAIQSPDIGQPGPFEAEVTYTVAATTRGRIVVYSASPRDGGLTHLASQEVVLAP
jgi:hypothetical protein